MREQLKSWLGHPWAGTASLLLALGLSGLAGVELYRGWRQGDGLQARLAAADAELVELRRLANEVQLQRGSTVPAVTGSPLSRIEQILTRHQVRESVAGLRPEGEGYELELRPLDYAALAQVIVDLESAALVIQSARLERAALPGRVTALLRITERR